MVKEIPLTQGKVALVDDEDFGELNQFKWFAIKRNPTSSCYYAAKYTQQNPNTRMHRFLINPPQDMQVDHIDGNGLNNQKSNLRVVTTRQNLQNRHTKKSTKYPGVCLVKGLVIKKFKARIWLKGKSINLGYFTTEPEAYQHYLDRLRSEDASHVPASISL